MTEEDIIKKYLGVPYLNNGRTMKGLDCYGLIINIYKDRGIELADLENAYDYDWSKKGKNYFMENYQKDWIQVTFPRFLDMVGFRSGKGIFNHAGVMLDEVNFIQTCRAGTVVSRVDNEQWRKRFMGYYRHKVNL